MNADERWAEAENLLRGVSDAQWLQAAAGENPAAHYAYGCAFDVGLVHADTAADIEVTLSGITLSGISEGVPGSSPTQQQQPPRPRSLEDICHRLSIPFPSPHSQMTAMGAVVMAERRLQLPLDGGKLFERIKRAQLQLAQEDTRYAAVKWWRKSADGGYGPAMTTVGDVHMSGYGGEDEDLSLAADWYWRAAQKGVVEAAKQLTVLVEEHGGRVSLPTGCRVRFGGRQSFEGTVEEWAAGRRSPGQHAVRVRGFSGQLTWTVDLDGSDDRFDRWEALAEGAEPWAHSIHQQSSPGPAPDSLAPQADYLPSPQCSVRSDATHHSADSPSLGFLSDLKQQDEVNLMYVAQQMGRDDGSSVQRRVDELATAARQLYVPGSPPELHTPQKSPRLSLSPALEAAATPASTTGPTGSPLRSSPTASPKRSPRRLSDAQSAPLAPMKWLADARGVADARGMALRRPSGWAVVAVLVAVLVGVWGFLHVTSSATSSTTPGGFCAPTTATSSAKRESIFYDHRAMHVDHTPTKDCRRGC